MGEAYAKNKKAFHDYFIEDKIEAGIVLKGSEVKGIRARRVNLKDSFIRFVKGELILFNMHIGRLETTHHFFGHEERGARKLLLHKSQLAKLKKGVDRDGYTIVPLQLYFNDRNIVKVQIGMAKGKKLHDKRNDLKEKDQKRDIERSMKDY
ncbi:MAG: SsrA-binding protein SmpB [Campylobacterales bacterium]|nr:SsrA-binding protein SmpB [Campylobacterales bacterium]